MKSEIQNEIQKIFFIFEKSWINKNDELILEPQNNIYFRLEDVYSILHFKCKFIAWVSRCTHKGVNDYWQKYFFVRFNWYLNTFFNIKELSTIYTYLGNDVNRELCRKFIENNYNLNIIMEYRNESNN